METVHAAIVLKAGSDLIVTSVPTTITELPVRSVLTVDQMAIVMTD